MTEPALPFKVKAIADYAATSAAELSLKVGDELVVSATDGRGVWWQSTGADGAVGWFPASYTQVVAEEAAVASEPLPPAPEPEPTPELAQPSAPILSAQSQPTLSVANNLPTENGAANLQRSASTVGAAAAPGSPKGVQRTGSMKKAGAKKGAKKTGSKKKMVTPPLKSHIEKNKKNTPTTLKIQLVEARGIRAIGGDMNKTSPTVFVFMRDVMDKDQIGRKIDCTATMKKTVEPRWNELFHLVVEDPESKELIVRVVSGKKYDAKDTKKFLGEVKFPLRGSVRDYDAPNYQYKWYPLAGKDATGKLRIFIEFTDTRSVSGPTNFQRVSHIGWSAEGGFDISNIPSEWKQLFKSVGIKKADLEDKDFAKTVFNIIQEHEKSEGGAPALPSGAAPLPGASAGAAPVPAATQTQATTQTDSNPANMVGYTSPDYPGWVWDGAQWVAADQFVPPTAVEIPAAPAPDEPAAGGDGAPAPPPPPPPPPSGGIPAAPRLSVASGPKKEVPPAAPDTRGNLLASIRGFSAGGLNKVEGSPKGPPPPTPGGGGGSLADTLKKAMEGHRRGISGANDTTDDWSDDEGGDDDDGWDD